MAESVKPTLLPLGDRALLIRFAETLSDAANLAALGLARQLESDRPEGVAEIAQGLVSVLLRLEPGVDFARLRGELMLRFRSESAPVQAATGSTARKSASACGSSLPGWMSNATELRCSWSITLSALTK